MVSGVTLAPGKTRMRTTVASVCAGISSIESSRGTRLPVDARTWRTSGPLFTVSGQMVERSTVGAAGLSRETAKPSTAKTTTATPVQMINWRFFFFFKSGRAISITPCSCICRANDAAVYAH